MNLRTKVCLQLLRALKDAPYKLKWQPLRHLEFKSSEDDQQRLTLRNACVVCVAPTTDLLGSQDRTFRVRVAGELDLTPDLLVLDFGLATIGLVHIVQISDRESLVDQAKRHVDQATYLRHLLVTHGVKAGTESFPLDYTVECVLVMQEEHAHQMINVVREIASKTRFLHATGLNLLNFRLPCELQPVEMRRAFAWLLSAARERLSGCKPPLARLRRLELLNYRLPGRRVWELESNRVHLLHGANGTGKSSIAEALELVVTGSVERIKTNPQADYARIIRNSESTGSATVKLSLTDGHEPEFKVIATGIEESALQQSLPVSAFRLDQTVMDQLIRTNSQQRARILTKSFFPGAAYHNLESAQEEFNQAYRELPVELRDEIAMTNPESNEWPAAVVPRLEWVEAPSIPVERIADCLPLKREHLETLGRIVPEITASLETFHGRLDRPTLETNLKQLDEALGRIRSNVRRYWEAVVQGLEVLPRLERWAPAPGEVRLEYPELLERWTERLALSDLLKKHLEISKSLLDARTAGWRAAEHDSVGLMADSVDSLRGSIESLSRASRQCNKEQEDLFKQLQSSAPAAAVGGETHPMTALSTGEIADLNLVGAWFARQEPTPPTELFGEIIEKALSENTSKVFGTITIGSQGWTKRPLEFLAPLKPALDALLAFDQTASVEPSVNAPTQSAAPPIYRSPLVRLHAYQLALTNARKVVAAYQDVEATLMKRLAEQKLNEALDEVITLFTPARWAYEGLLINPNVLDGKVAVELVTTKTGSQAETRLNTAELNLVVLALYLLCGPTIANPLGTVILDDPLQNMDELTSATVARGVTKVASLLSQGWQLIMMFHGDEDLETFRREVPGSVYSLPWLGPIGAAGPDGNNVILDTRRQRVSSETQKLNEVVRLDLNRRRVRDAHRSGVAEPGKT